MNTRAYTWDSPCDTFVGAETVSETIGEPGEANMTGTDDTDTVSAFATPGYWRFGDQRVMYGGPPPPFRWNGTLGYRETTGEEVYVRGRYPMGSALAMCTGLQEFLVVHGLAEPPQPVAPKWEEPSCPSLTTTR